VAAIRAECASLLPCDVNAADGAPACRAFPGRNCAARRAGSRDLGAVRGMGTPLQNTTQHRVAATLVEAPPARGHALNAASVTRTISLISDPAVSLRPSRRLGQVVGPAT